MLARNLPAGAQTWVDCDFENAWTVGDYLAAFQADVGQVANWQRGGGEGPRPKPLPRPGDARKAQEKGDRIRAQARAFEARQRASTEPTEEA